jgi:hypothetical protein
MGLRVSHIDGNIVSLPMVWNTINRLQARRTPAFNNMVGAPIQTTAQMRDMFKGGAVL